jgi:hypothetical protein
MIEDRRIVPVLIRGMVRNKVWNPNLKLGTTVNVAIFTMTGVCATL